MVNNTFEIIKNFSEAFPHLEGTEKIDDGFWATQTSVNAALPRPVRDCSAKTKKTHEFHSDTNGIIKIFDLRNLKGDILYMSYIIYICKLYIRYRICRLTYKLIHSKVPTMPPNARWVTF